MAQYAIRPLEVIGEDSYLNVLIRTGPEAASSTFSVDSPLIDVSGAGYLGIAADPVASGTLIGFARKAGANNATAGGARTEYVRAVPGMLIAANFLTNAGATNAYAVTDLYSKFDCHLSSVLPPDSDPMWHMADATADPFAQMISDISPQSLPNVVEAPFAAGDSDVRALFAVLNTALSIDA